MQGAVLPGSTESLGELLASVWFFGVSHTGAETLVLCRPTGLASFWQVLENSSEPYQRDATQKAIRRAQEFWREGTEDSGRAAIASQQGDGL